MKQIKDKSKSAEKYNIPLEINLNDIFCSTYHENGILNNEPIEKQKAKLKNVSYPCREFWKIALEYNIKVLYGIDDHHRGQVLVWNELLELAKDIIGEETINKLNFIEEQIYVIIKEVINCGKIILQIWSNGCRQVNRFVESGI